MARYDDLQGMNIARMLVLAGVFMSVTAAQVHAIQEPKFEVVRSVEVDGKEIEYRDYAPYVVAETVVEAPNLKKASSEGFRRLANYIFGGNASEESMAMTAPVGTTGSEGRYTISFVMPAKHSLESLPAPRDARITLRQVPARKVAAIVFSGFWSTNNFESHRAALQAHLASEGVEILSAPFLARYNMPLTPWFLRRNEILIDIR
jgi:hypothetical protein